MKRYTLFSLVFVLAAVAPAAAQDQLVIERIQNGWMIAPDARVADLDGRIGSLAGVYGGRLHDRKLFVGAGGYWLTNREPDFKLWYGGGVVEWLARTDKTVGFGVRALIGGGSGTLPTTIGDLVGDRGVVDGRSIRFGSRRFLDADTIVAVRDDFFITEPQVNVLWNFSRQYRLSAGAGYRLIGAAPLLGDRLAGLSGTVAFQIGGR